jgi:D-aminopeptidase
MKRRARELGLPFLGLTGPANAITDVEGLEVGYKTLVGSGGDHEIRTGVTVILPRGRSGPAFEPVWAGFHALNGNGEMTGVHWIREGGFFQGPIGITNTHSVGIVHHSLARWMAEMNERERAAYAWMLPVVAETSDAFLNDMNGFHVTEQDVHEAIDSATAGAIAEGNVGGGTGMTCFEFKGGTGTSSRVVTVDGRKLTVGSLVQANFGLRPQLRVLGVPVGEHLDADRIWAGEQGSIIALVATDAPLLPTQLERLARRAGIGIARTGSYAGDGSGDLCLAFTTACAEPPKDDSAGCLRFLPNKSLDTLFEATAQAVEEAILNALVAAETMTGRDGRRAVALDHEALRETMRAYRRLSG